MGIKKIFLTGLFFAMALMGWAQDSGFNEDGDTYFINTVDDLNALNELCSENPDFLSDVTLVFAGGEYNLGDQWRSCINIRGNVIGNGAVIKFTSKDDEEEGYATGLFNEISGEISIEGLTIDASISLKLKRDFPNAGLLVCTMSLSEPDCILIKSVNVKGSISRSSEYVWNGFCVGGLIGYVNGADDTSLTVQDCKSAVAINDACKAGGIVGEIRGGTVVLKNSISEGAISSISVAGGLVGSYSYVAPAEGTQINKLDISGCANVGRLFVNPTKGTENIHMGGLVGDYYSDEDYYEDERDEDFGLIIDRCCNTGGLEYTNNTGESILACIGSLVGRDQNASLYLNLTNSFVCYDQNSLLGQQKYPFVCGRDNEYYETVYDNSEGSFRPENTTFVVESQEDFKKMVLAVSAYNVMGIQQKVEIKGDFNFTDIDYAILRSGEIESTLGGSKLLSIGSYAPFNGTMKGDGSKFYKYAANQNSLFDKIGAEGVVEGISIPNGVVLDDLGKSEKDSDGKVYVAMLSNKNSGKISYCSYVGAVYGPDDAENVVPCLVGENEGEVSYSFLYVTNLNEVKAITSGISEDNKAAIIVKGNTGVGKKAGGKQKKVAVNNVSNKSWALLPDAYFTPDDAELNKEERGFSNEEFASGVVAYWLNYAEAGYTGEYTCRYSQGEYTPELQSEAQAASDGGAAVHKIVYDVPEGTSISSGAKPFANGGEEVVITLSKPVKSATVTVGESNKSAATATISADGKTITFTVPKTKKPVVTLAASNNATPLTRVEPNAEVKIVVIDGKIKVFGAQGETVVVYGINGAVLHSEVLTSDKVDLPAVPHGIYFVKVGRATKKISL
ncbi:MAG: DUF6383 domain-containing protein [Bacteroidales bacterium]|nr:DUF6383 domain-containing protein [Bacteroidales bacterium]